MSSSYHSHHLHHQHFPGTSNSNLDFLNSALVSILSTKYPELSLNDDAITYIKYLTLKIVKILLSGHPITTGHSSTSPLTSTSGTTITNSIGSTNGPTVGTLSSRSSTSSILIRLADLEERINLTFPCGLDEEIMKAAHKILIDLNSSDSTFQREGSLSENSSSGKISLLNQAGIAKLSGKNKKVPPKQHPKQKLDKIRRLTSDHVIHIPFLSFSNFLRELIGGGKETKFDPEPDVIVYIMVVIEYIIKEILESSGKFVSNISKASNIEKTNISKEDIKISLHSATSQVIKSLFNPDVDVSYDHEDVILCLQSNNPGNSSSNLQSSSLCLFSLDLDPKFISKLIENKENEKLRQSVTGSISHQNPDVSNALYSITNSSTSTLSCGTNPNHIHRSSQLFANLNNNVTYEDVVKELISEEKLFIRDLHLVIKLFRESFEELRKQQETDSSSLPSSPTSPTTPNLTSSSLLSTVALLNDQSSVPSSPIHKSFGTRIKDSDIRAIFSNISDIEELSVKLLISLEDTLEALISSNLSNDDVTKSGSGINLAGSNPGSVTSMSKSVIESIGSVFQEFAEDLEFNVYDDFASEIIGTQALHQNNNHGSNGSKNNSSNQSTIGYDWSTSPSNQVLQELLADNMISKPLSTAGKGFLQQIKYILPKVLVGIIYHCFTYFNYISILKRLSPSEEDKEAFSAAEGPLKTLEFKLVNLTGITFRDGKIVPVLFGQHFFSLHHPGLSPSTTSPSSANSGTLNPTNGASSLKSSATSSVTSFCPLISYSLTLSSVNTNAKIVDLISKIDGIDLSLHKEMNCLILDGPLYKSSATSKSHPKISERKVFLFDGVLLLCKDVLPSKKSSKVSTSGSLIQYGQTKRYLMSEIEVVDLPDPMHSSASFSAGSSNRDPCNNSAFNPNLPGQQPNEDQLSELSSLSSMSLRSNWATSTSSLVSTTSSNVIHQNSGLGTSLSVKYDYVPRVKNAFGIIVKESKEFIVLSADSAESKILWISNLIFLTSRMTLQKNLETILSEEDRRNPLQLPSPSVYPFTVPDSESNIIFEENKFNNAGAPLIKAATMAKLIERLTYHLHADPTFVRVFLTTYRSFSNPRELLTYLIERFEVPLIESKAREDVKKFQKDYVKPVQLRVLNVIRHWVDQHFYDFTNDEELLDDLVSFLDKKAGQQKALKKWVDSILKNIIRNRDNSKNNQLPDFSLLFNSSPPHFEWHIISAENVSTAPKEMFNLLSIHPIEFARQLTLFEYELFKRVKPSELVDCAWTKKDKERTSPNLLKFTTFGNNYMYWLEQQILETENFEERVAVYSRILEILQVFQELNNFDGIICTVGALESASVHRLVSTKEVIPKGLKKAFEEAQELEKGHHKTYFEMLRRINPPCVPFLGNYLSYIVQIHEGNSDETRISVRDELRSYATGESIETSTLSLINFSKRRKIAEITQEIQQYQNTPYCLNQEPRIRGFLESIKPLSSPGFIEYVKKKAQEEGKLFDLDSMPQDGSDGKVKYFNDYLHELSLDIEPRKLPDEPRRTVKKAERRWPELSLKSPGIRPSPAPTTPTVTSTTASSTNTVLANTLSRVQNKYRGVFASAVATSGLSLSNNKSHNSGLTNNLNDASYSTQISPNAVVLSFRDKDRDHYPITLPSNQGSGHHHHHVRQSSLTQPRQGSMHGSQHHSVAPLTPLPYSASLNSFSDQCIFAPVMIGGVPNYGGTGYPPLTPLPSTPLTPGHRGQFSFSGTGSNPAPPALPPRRQRLTSTTSQSYDESMSSHCSGGSDITLQPPPRPPQPITPLLPSTPSTAGSSSMGTLGSAQSQAKNIFNFPPPLPPAEATPPSVPPRPEKLNKLISSLSSDVPQGATASATTSLDHAVDSSNAPPPPLPPRGVQPASLVHRHSFHRGSSSQSLYQTSPSSNAHLVRPAP